MANLQKKRRNNANVKTSEGDKVKNGHHNNFLAEAVSGGVQVTCNGSVLPLMPYKDALNRLESGCYDSLDRRDDGNLHNGASIAYAILDGVEAGYWNSTAQDLLVLWRWMIATAFVFETIKQYGIITIVNNGQPELTTVYLNERAGITANPFATRFGLASNVEPLLIEQFGSDGWEAHATRFYAHMAGHDGEYLSEFGRMIFTQLYDALIQHLEEGGQPAAPVIH